jgi:hypothetical protein
MPAVRAAQHHHNDAVFRRESFLCRVVGCDIRLSSVTNSPRLSAGGACPSTADSDIPCRVHGSPPRLPPLGCAAAPLLERRVLPRLPGPIHRAPVRAHDFTAQDVFDWCDPDPLGPGVVTSRKVNPRFRNWNTRAAHAYSFPPVKVMGRRRRLASAVPPGPCVLRRQPEDPTKTGCLSPGRCNQLVVNEHPWCPPTPEREALTSLTSPRAPSLSPTRMC